MAYIFTDDKIDLNISDKNPEFVYNIGNNDIFNKYLTDTSVDIYYTTISSTVKLVTASLAVKVKLIELALVAFAEFKPAAVIVIDGTVVSWVQANSDAAVLFLQIVGGDDDNIKHFIVNGKGNVGIGIENPDSSLEVNKFKKGDLVRLNNTNPDGNGLILGADQYPLKIGKSNSLEGEFLSVKGNGNVGIGERNPDNKLVVRGTIQADKFVNKDGVLIGGEQDTTLEATTICLNNGKTGTDFEKLCLGIDDFKFIKDFKKVMQYSANEKNSWIF